MRHGQEEDRQTQRRTDPEAADHIVQFGIIPDGIRRDRLGVERHSADRAIPRVIAFDLRMHRAGVERSGGRLPPRGLGRRYREILPVDELCRIGLESGLTRRGTEVVGFARVLPLACGRLGFHLHAAHWILSFQRFTWNCATPGVRRLSSFEKKASPAKSREMGNRKNANRMDNLTSYLNDHLAGSVGALELVDRLIDTYRGKRLEKFFGELRSEIEADQETLKELIASFGEKESAIRKAGAWVVEKLSRAKIQLSETREGEMGLFLALEGLALGIHGKQTLWRALSAASATIPGLCGLDYDRLEKRALEQYERVEGRRLEVAGKVFKN